MTHYFVVSRNIFGVLARVTGIVSASGVNIDSAAAYPISGSELSVIHLRLTVDSAQAERLRRKLARLVVVLEVRMDEELRSLSVDLGTLASLIGVQSQRAGQTG
jgi:acetolactate synthase small subunit